MTNSFNKQESLIMIDTEINVFTLPMIHAGKELKLEGSFLPQS
jgi:hypothetical protein